MTKEQVNELLTNIISTYAPQFGRALTKAAARKLADSAVEEQLENITGSTYTSAKTALSECGIILEENMSDGSIAGVIQSGAANMNPAFVLLSIEGNTIHMKASAKEGLIKQHTAKRAIEIFKLALARSNQD